MYFSSELTALMAAILVSSSIASPLQHATPASTVKCNDPKTGVAPTCWTSLKVADYLTGWEKKNSPGTCKEGESWSTCFNALAASHTGEDCTEISSTKCEKFDPKLHYLSPQWYYGSYNTWSINQFFTAWSVAIEYIAKGNPSIINTAAQPADFDALTAAHNKNLVSIDIALNNLIIQAPKNPQNAALTAVLKTFKSFTTYDAGRINTADPPIATLLQVRLEQVLKHVETDIPSFLDMAAEGAFSTADITTSADLTKALWPNNGAVASIDG